MDAQKIEFIAPSLSSLKNIDVASGNRIFQFFLGVSSFDASRDNFRLKAMFFLLERSREGTKKNPRVNFFILSSLTFIKPRVHSISLNFHALLLLR